MFFWSVQGSSDLMEFKFPIPDTEGQDWGASDTLDGVLAQLQEHSVYNLCFDNTGMYDGHERFDASESVFLSFMRTKTKPPYVWFKTNTASIRTTTTN